MRRIFLYVVFFIASGKMDLYSQIVHLPVELVYFNFQILDSTKVLLNWGTATEVDNYGFSVERYSDSTWASIIFIQGHGNSNVPNYYSCVDSTIEAGKTFLYRLKQIDVNGGIKYSDTLTVSIISDIKKENNNYPKNFFVSQNYPNPFNPSTNIRVEISEVSEIIFKVYDSQGKMVLERNYGEKMPGVYLISFNASNFSSGIYYYSIFAGTYWQTHPMILLK